MIEDTGFDDTHIKLAAEKGEKIENIVDYIGDKYELTPVDATKLAMSKK
jgi:hypothetical protein